MDEFNIRINFIELDTLGNVLKVEFQNDYYAIQFAHHKYGIDSLKTISYFENNSLIRVDSIFSYLLKDKLGNDFKFFCAKVYKKGSLLNKEFNYYNDEYYNKAFERQEIGFINLPLKKWEQKTKDDKFILLTKKLPTNYNDTNLFHCESNMDVDYMQNLKSENSFHIFKTLKNLSKSSRETAKKIIGKPINLPPFKEPYFFSTLNENGHCGGSRIRTIPGSFQPEPIRKNKVYTNNPRGVDDTLFIEYNPIVKAQVVFKPTHPDCTHYLKGWSCTPVRRINSTFRYTYFSE